MTDPVYEYKKGEGWVCIFIQAFEFTTRDGLRFLAEVRLPRENELYRCRAKWDGWEEDGKPCIDVIKRILTASYKTDFTTNRNPKNREPDQFTYVTLIPLD